MKPLEQKRCTKCGDLKLLGEFRKHRSRGDGLDSQCKACHAARNKRWRKANREWIEAYNKRWREANPGYGKQYNDSHRDECAAREKQYRDTHRAEHAINYKRWGQENREKKAACGQRYRARKVDATIEDFDIIEVYERDGYTCTYCGSTEDLTIDHIVPLSKGGSHRPENLCVACRSCNSSKGAKNLGRWIRWKARMAGVGVLRDGVAAI